MVRCERSVRWISIWELSFQISWIRYRWHSYMLAFQIWQPSCTEQESVISIAKRKQTSTEPDARAGWTLLRSESLAQQVCEKRFVTYTQVSTCFMDNSLKWNIKVIWMKSNISWNVDIWYYCSLPAKGYLGFSLHAQSYFIHTLH